nr:MAG TPA: hypothetical protein [Caudoviricetes sp.]
MGARAPIEGCGTQRPPPLRIRWYRCIMGVMRPRGKAPQALIPRRGKHHGTQTS